MKYIQSKEVVIIVKIILFIWINGQNCIKPNLMIILMNKRIIKYKILINNPNYFTNKLSRIMILIEYEVWMEHL